MRLLADENVPRPSIVHLRAAVLDVAAMTEDDPGASDRAVLARAASEGRVVIAFDRDYGDLVFRQRLPPPPGVVYFRFTPSTPEEPATILLQLLALADVQLEGSFTVVERRQIRQRPLT